jgi:CheY-like chemotaxis protein/HPt (histidine-containing phosphotransfer) domain-containing protein
LSKLVTKNLVTFGGQSRAVRDIHVLLDANLGCYLLNENDSIEDETFLDLKGEFLMDARDGLRKMEDFLNEIYLGAVDSGDILVQMKREVHTLKGMGSAFGLPLITVLCHRLEDYIESIRGFSVQQSIDIQFHIDRIWDIVRHEKNPGKAQTKEVLRSLPIFREVSDSEIKEQQVEVLVVSRSRTIGLKIKDELSAYDFRVVSASNAEEALSMTVAMHPDIVITSGVLEMISGFDLVRAMVAMSITRDIPLVVVTSFDLEHPEIIALPSDIPVVQLGASLAKELAIALTNLEYRFLKN